MNILSNGNNNAKTIKSNKKNLSDLMQDLKDFVENYNKVNTGIIYFAPASLSGKNVCGSSSPACREACLYSAGRGKMSNVKKIKTETIQKNQKVKMFKMQKVGFKLHLPIWIVC